MRELGRVTDDIGLVRDMNSNALLSNDRSAFERRKNRKKDVDFQQNIPQKYEQLLERVRVLEEWIANHG